MERVTETQICDQCGRPLETSELKRPETRQVAVAALRDRFSTYPTAGLTPERLAAIFQDADQGNVSAQAELFEEIERDPHIGAVLGTPKNAVLGLDLVISPASESAEDKKICEFVQAQFDGFRAFDETLLDLLDAIGKGFNLTEVDWQVSVGGQAEIARLRWLHPKRVTFVKLVADQWAADDLTPRLLTEKDELEGEEIPPFKALYHRYKARSGYDTAAGVLRVVSWMYLFKNYALKDWVVFSEVFGMPLRLGKYSPGASKDDRQAVMQAVRSLGSDAAGIISQSTEIEFIHAIKSGGDPPYKILCEWCDKQISKAILGQTLTTETDGKGSYAAGKVHNEVREDLLEADAKSLARTLRDQLVRPLVGFNFGWDKPLPKVELPIEETEDLKNLADVFGILSEKLGYPFTLEQVSERFKIRTPEKGETLLRAGTEAEGTEAQSLKAVIKQLLPPQVGARPPGRERSSLAALSSVPGIELTPEQEAIEGLKKSSTTDLQALAEPLLEPIFEIFRESASLEEARGRIADAFDDMDAALLTKALTEALFSGALAGNIDAESNA